MKLFKIVQIKSDQCNWLVSFKVNHFITNFELQKNYKDRCSVHGSDQSWSPSSPIMKSSLCFLIVHIFLTTVVLALPIDRPSHNAQITPNSPAPSYDRIDHVPHPPGLPLPGDHLPDNPGQTPSSHLGSLESDGHRPPPSPAPSDEGNSGIDHLPWPPGLPYLYPENPGQTPSSPHKGSSRRRVSAPPQRHDDNPPPYGEHVHHEMFLA